MQNRLIFIFLVVIVLFACKRKKTGCMDIEAVNFDGAAQVSDGSCKYSPLILNPSFEFPGDWSTYSGTGFSMAAGGSNTADGFMPTSGQYFFKCTPTINYSNGTSTKQYLNYNKHYKGFYFDYSYTAKGGADSIIIAYVVVGTIFGQMSPINWVKNISATPSSFGGYPIINVQKRDEYIELPISEQAGIFGIITTVTKGTFTFCIDNIREVQR